MKNKANSPAIGRGTWVEELMSICTPTVSLRKTKRGGEKNIENKANFAGGEKALSSLKTR